jgi:predicted O-methyltransferase YrrM
MKNKLLSIFEVLDEHIAKCKKENNLVLEHDGYIEKGFSLGDTQRYNNLQIGLPFVIQQVKEEIQEFVNVLLNSGLNENVLEIGLGRYGSTHILWREIFNNVVTLECNNFRIKDCANFTDGRSTFICCDSNNPDIVKILPHITYDLLFIDGAHDYNSIKKDYLNFSSLVRKGGIIAFHDVLSDDYEVKPFIEDLKNGLIDKKRDIKIIQHSSQLGIGYFVQGN